MRILKSGLQHLQGNEAYQIYWEQAYKCRPRLSSIMAIDLNLEIIVDSDGLISAYRYEHPKGMQGMDINCGKWCLYEEDAMGVKVKNVVQEMILNLRIRRIMT